MCMITRLLIHVQPVSSPCITVARMFNWTRTHEMVFSFYAVQKRKKEIRENCGIVDKLNEQHYSFAYSSWTTLIRSSCSEYVQCFHWHLQWPALGFKKNFIWTLLVSCSSHDVTDWTLNFRHGIIIKKKDTINNFWSLHQVKIIIQIIPHYTRKYSLVLY